VICIPINDIMLVFTGFVIASILWLVISLNTGDRNDGNGF